MKKTDMHQDRGFTLVEMLIVVVIIGILVTVVVGVSRMVIARAANEKTRMYMQTIMLAIDAYHEATGNYPAEGNLYQQLIAVPAAKKRLSALPDDAVKDNVFVDGFEKHMYYFRTGGIGGLPVLISAGADRTFDTEDDIRSDNR